jgi:hypothetical protein
MPKMPDTLEGLREKIEEESNWVDIKPYSNTLIMLYLQKIDKDYGKDAANQAIVDCGLLDLVWNIRE